MEYILLVTDLSTDLLKFLLISLSFLYRLIFLEIPIFGDNSGNLGELTRAIQLGKKPFQYFLK